MFCLEQSIQEWTKQPLRICRRQPLRILLGPFLNILTHLQREGKLVTEHSINFSTGDEMGMIEDIYVGFKTLSCVNFKVCFFSGVFYYCLTKVYIYCIIF